MDRSHRNRTLFAHLMGLGSLAVLTALVLTVPVPSSAAGGGLSPSAALRPTGRPIPKPTVSTRPRPRPSIPTAAPTSSGPTCVPETFDGQQYCAGNMPGIRTGAYGEGARIVVHALSVTATTGTSITVEYLVYHECPPGRICGAGFITSEIVNISWPTTPRPDARSVINLFGVTQAGSIVPVGFTPSTGCYIDFC